MRLLVLVTMVILLSGCAEPTADVAAPAAKPAPSEPDAPPEPVDVPADNGSTDPDPVQERLVSEQGFLPEGIGAPGTAMASTAALGGGDRWFRIDTPGTVTGVDITMTWTASSPGTENLRLTVTPVETNANGDQFYSGDTRFVEGPSPLRMDLQGLDWKGGDYVATAWWAGEATAGIEQDFTIEGTVFHI